MTWTNKYINYDSLKITKYKWVICRLINLSYSFRNNGLVSPKIIQYCLSESLETQGSLIKNYSQEVLSENPLATLPPLLLIQSHLQLHSRPHAMASSSSLPLFAEDHTQASPTASLTTPPIISSIKLPGKAAAREVDKLGKEVGFIPFRPSLSFHFYKSNG